MHAGSSWQVCYESSLVLEFSVLSWLELGPTFNCGIKWGIRFGAKHPKTLLRLLIVS